MGLASGLNSARDTNNQGEGAGLRTLVLKLMKRAKRLVKDAYRYTAFRCPHSRGVFSTFEEARASAPRGGSVGYDNADLAREYKNKLVLTLRSFDYPVLFHLDRILRDISGPCTILDFGGNIGVHYLRLQKYLDLQNVTWIVCDVPAMVKAGRDVCADIPNIRFVDDLAELKDAHVDVVLVIGSMQYVESLDVLAPILERTSRPRHILIDQVSLYEGQRFVTLQNGGLVYYPEFIFNRVEYINDFTERRYSLIDFWDCDENYTIPFHPERTTSSYGIYFRDET